MASASRPAAKRASSTRAAAPKKGRAGAKGKTASPPRAPAEAVRRSHTPADEDGSLRDLALRLGKLKVAGLARVLVEGWRTDLTTIVDANRKSYAGLQAIVARQTEQIKDVVGEIRSVARLVQVIGVKKSARSLDDLAVASLELALADIRELAELAATSQREAFELVQRRVVEHVDQVQKLLRE